MKVTEAQKTAWTAAHGRKFNAAMGHVPAAEPLVWRRVAYTHTVKRKLEFRSGHYAAADAVAAEVVSTPCPGLPESSCR